MFLYVFTTLDFNVASSREKSLHCVGDGDNKKNIVMWSRAVQMHKLHC